MGDVKKQTDQSNQASATPAQEPSDQAKGATTSTGQAAAPRPPFPQSHMTFDHALDADPPGTDNE
jgi:hypothetical protein